MGHLQQRLGSPRALPGLTLCKAQICTLLLHYAMVLEEGGAAPEAVGLLRRLVHYAPACLAARLCWGWILLKQGTAAPDRLIRACTVLNAAAQANPMAPGPYVLLALAYYRMREYAMAVDQLDRCFAVQPHLRHMTADDAVPPALVLIHIVRGAIKKALADGEPAVVREAVADFEGAPCVSAWAMVC